MYCLCFVDLCGYICWMCVCVLCCQWVHVFSLSEETKTEITMRSWKPPCLMLFQGSCTLQSGSNYWNEESEPIISLLLNHFICSFVMFTCIIYFETHCTLNHLSSSVELGLWHLLLLQRYSIFTMDSTVVQYLYHHSTMVLFHVMQC